MIGTYDFCAHYEWTFEWLRQQGGESLVQQYWEEAIYQDSQQHATALIQEKGFDGMLEYWGHTLLEESPSQEFTLTPGEGILRCDMHDCPSKGFLLRNNLEQYHDYCDHCIGWVGPLMKDAGYAVTHAHNHCGQCWWEICRADDSPDSPAPTPKRCVENEPSWNPASQKIDRFF